MSLKKLTQSKHSNAERSWFAALMISGKISNKQYAVYLKQQFECYNALEKRFDKAGETVVSLPRDLKRANNIIDDLQELSCEVDSIPIFDSTKKYVNYILDECKTKNLYAHGYVRYLGDLKGGQIIAKRVPGSGTYYKFKNPKELEIFIRSQLCEDEEFVKECNNCFDASILLFENLKNYLEKRAD